MAFSKLLQIQINWLCLPVTRQPQIHHYQIWCFLMNSCQKSHICEVEILGSNLQRNCVKWIFLIVNQRFAMFEVCLRSFVSILPDAFLLIWPHFTHVHCAAINSSLKNQVSVINNITYWMPFFLTAEPNRFETAFMAVGNCFSKKAILCI